MHFESHRCLILCRPSETVAASYKTSLRRVRRERLVAQTRSDQNREFAFRAAAERAQVEQDDLPSRNILGLGLERSRLV